MSSKMLTPEQVCTKRLKIVEKSTNNLQSKPKEIPLLYKNASLVLNYMKIRRLNLYEAIDAAVTKDQMETIGKSVEELVRKTLDHEQEINYLIKKVKIMECGLDLDPFMVKILIAEMLWGRYFMKFSTMDTIYVRYYEQDMREEFSETVMRFDSYEDSYCSKLPVYIRINTLAISLEASINAFYEEGWNLLPRPSNYSDFLSKVRDLKGSDYIRDFHISELFVFPIGTSFYEHPGYLEGKFLLQDKGSCLSTFLLNPKPGSHVLDMCAAPGIKTNHIANMIQNEGIIYACEKYPERYNKLCSQMNLTNVTCAKLIHDENLNLEINDLNYILLDVPSTYSGIFHKKDIGGLGNTLRHFQFKSRTALQYALQNFPNVKRVVFTSCSIFADEGERVVADALNRIDNSFTLLDVREMLWKEWITVGQEYEYPFSGKCLRTKPEFDLCQGHFIAVFERNFSVPVPPYIKKPRGINSATNDVNQKVVTLNSGASTSKKNTELLNTNPMPKSLSTIKKVRKPRSKKKKKKIPDVVQNPNVIPSRSGLQFQYPSSYNSKNETT